MELVLEYKNKNTKFGVSPFAIGMTHQDVALEAQIAMQLAMREVTDEDLNRY